MFGRFDVVYQPKIGKIGKNLNFPEISRFRSFKNRVGLKFSENLREGPGVKGTTEVRPTAPIAWVTSKYTFFFAKNSKNFRFLFAILSTTNDRSIMKFS